MHTNQTNNPVEFFPKNGVIYITLSGDVLTYNVERDLQKIDEQVQADAHKIVFMPDGLKAWDSSLVLILSERKEIVDSFRKHYPKSKDLIDYIDEP